MDFSSERVTHPPVPPAASAAAAFSLPGVLRPAGAAVAEGSPAAPAQLLLFVGEAIRPDTTLVALLAREGLRCLSLPGAEQAVRAATLARFDAVLIDAALVDGRAARAIETLASSHRCPLIVLAEQADEVDEIVALELGADLYLARPLAPRRLRAHLHALLRRRIAAVEAAQPADGLGAGRPLQAGGWSLQFAQQRLTRGPRSVRLTHAQAALLRCLMDAAGDIVPAEHLLAALPQHERLQTRSLRVHVHRLRQRLRDEAVHELQVEAVRGSGYALAVPCAEAA
ncbi:MAG: response regulator transcription factor [Burkholderiales bacterium]|nr:response regulator transcription factor [Burkholderiales bacterium]